MIQPKIRFNGFKDEWVEGRLKDILKLRNIVPTSTQKKLPVLTSSRQGLMNQSDYYKDRLVSSKDLSKYHIVSENAITYRQMSDDNVFVFNQNKLGYAGLVSPAYPVMIYNSNVISEYLMTYLNNSVQMKQEIHLSVEGTTRTSLPFAKLSKFKIQLPTLPEQQKIGALFSKYDAIIALREQKLAELNALKKGLLQQMFPENSAKVPELRFKGFADEWKERKLGEILSERNDQMPETNEYPLMSFVQGKGVTPKGERYNRSFLVKDSEKKYKKTELGDFIYSSNNLETGSIGFNRTGKAVISPIYSVFKSKKSQESQFIGIMSARKDFISKMVRFRQGVVYGQWKIHESDFLNIDIKMPNDKEQQKIGQLFKHLDTSISNEQSKIEQLKAQKQGLLQKMIS